MFLNSIKDNFQTLLLVRKRVYYNKSEKMETQYGNLDTVD